MKPAKPFIYALSTCVHCKAAKKFLREHGIEFDYVDVDRLSGKEKQDAISEMKRVSGSYRFPTIIVGDAVIVGFYEEKVKGVLGVG